MDDNAIILVQAIEDAYNQHISCPSQCVGQIKFGELYDDERKDISKFFSDKEWRDLNMKSLSYKRYYMHGLTSEGLYYYLPAFFISALKYPNSELVESLVFLLVDNAGRSEVRALIKRMADNGKLCPIVEALEAISDHYYSYSEEERVKARGMIKKYWTTSL